jgi:hypothetical protein
MRPRSSKIHDYVANGLRATDQKIAVSRFFERLRSVDDVPRN